MTIVVTGGTRGIGFAIAEGLADAGEQIVLGYRSNEAAADAAVARLEALGATAVATPADVGTIEGAAALIARAAALGGPITGLVHSAAMIYPTTLLQADLALFTQAVQTNGLSLLYLVRAALPSMPRGGSIVFVSSAGARTSQARYGALGTGKALAESLMRYLAPELAPLGVRINAIAPGLMETDSVADMVGGQEAAERLFERAAKANPSGRLTSGRDCAALTRFLLSRDAEFIQGQVIHANGGAYVGG
ncbi:MAG: SDR family oxidoreductase [Proteobacteria bacterium]|nr:SDR family oxidoreductase [Pseudomonadota bacterium]